MKLITHGGYILKNHCKKALKSTKIWDKKLEFLQTWEVSNTLSFPTIICTDKVIIKMPVKCRRSIPIKWSQCHDASGTDPSLFYYNRETIAHKAK